MRCLMCGREKEEVSLRDLLDGTDPLCSQCRNAWQRKDLRFHLDGKKVYAPYIYNEAFADCLIQFKENGDEALKDVFLHGLEKKMRRMYRGRVLILMPSSAFRMKQRGFSHLAEMFSCTGMKILEPFEKKDHMSQKGKGRSERMQIVNSIRLQENADVPRRIVLCDDTITTGATLSAAMNCLDPDRHDICIFALSANRRWMKEARQHPGKA